jgi:BarA-like signal transduction histidine kinase
MLQCEGLAFADVLTEEEIDEAFEEEEATFAEDDDCVYTPAITIWAFLSQVLHKEEQRSCLAAVSRVIVLLVSLGLNACAKNNGAYCKARAKVPEKVIRRLATELAAGCEQQVPRRSLWHGRHVKLADGTTVSMPDTEENQAEYPQQKGQKEGLGFPIARMMVLMSLATGMLCDMAMGPYSGKETGESALLRTLLASLDPRDILLIDQLHCSYFTIAAVLLGKGDFVARLHHARKADFRKGKRLGRSDYLMTWTRPDRPEWMDVATYEEMPETITVRIVEVKVDEPGFRTESFHVATTLTDAEQYTKDDIADLYRKRWLVELDIRSIKVSLGMDILRCKTPEMVRKEIWTCLLAYNLIRKTMLQAAHAAGVSPRELSFANALTTIAASFVNLPVADDTTAERLIEAQLITLTEQIVGKRPDRYEPRAVKRRPKPHRYLTMTRDEARAMLASGIDPYAKKK